MVEDKISIPAYRMEQRKPRRVQLWELILSQPQQQPFKKLFTAAGLNADKLPAM